MLRCLIADDNAAFLEAASALLEREGMTVVGVASTAADALRLARELRPDVALVDIKLGSEGGLELAKRLDHSSSATVILISTRAEADFADLIADTPAVGFMAKSDLSADAITRLAGAGSEQ